MDRHYRLKEMLQSIKSNAFTKKKYFDLSTYKKYFLKNSGSVSISMICFVLIKTTHHPETNSIHHLQSRVLTLP